MSLIAFGVKSGQRVFQGNKSSGHIADCRPCWDRKVKNMVYWLH